MSGDGWGNESNEDDFSLDTGEISGSDLEGGGELINKEGWYHLECTEVVKELDTVGDNGKTKAPKIRFDLLVLETVPGQSPAGSRHFHRINVGGNGDKPLAEGSVKAALRFGIGMGLLESIPNPDDPEKTIVVVKGTKSTRISTKVWEAAKGRQTVAKIAFEKGKNGIKDSFQIPFGRCYTPDDPTVSDVPKNAEAMAMLGMTSAASSAPPGKTSSTKPPATPPAPAAVTPPATPAASSEWLDDI